MKDQDKSPSQLLAELEVLRRRVCELEAACTEARTVESLLRQGHDELRAIYEGMVDGLLIADKETKRFVRANASICQMLGYSESELLSMSVNDIHPPEDWPVHAENFRKVVAGQWARSENLPVVRKDGSVFVADIVGNQIVYHGRPCVVGFFRDITECRQAQEALQRERRTLRRLLQSSDHERQLIAYEIHDGLAQQLAAALMQFQTYGHLKERQPANARTAHEAGVEMVRQAHAEARRLISGVRPPILDESGIAAAIAHLVHDQKTPRGPQIEFQSRAAFHRLTSILENAIYRIAQEALTNACKHSQSEKVRVSLIQDKDLVILEVRDWGIGFDGTAVGEERFGLEGIKERVRLLGGELSLESHAGEGTSVRVTLPMLEQK